MIPMLVIRWTLTVALSAMAVLLDVSNVVTPMVARKRGQHISPVPFFGAIFGIAACLLCPLPGTVKAIPVALLLDITVVGLLIVSLTWIFGRGR
jgi:hypothetical protein